MGLDVKKVAAEQGVGVNAIYSRVHVGWTLDEILAGKRPKKKRVMEHRYDYACGNTAFRVMISDVVSSLAGGDRWEPHLGAMVFMGLLLAKLNS